MSSPVVSSETLIAEARGGDEAALATLLARCGEKLAVSRGALGAAAQEFSTFTGKTESELLDWIGSRIARDEHDTAGPDATLAKPRARPTPAAPLDPQQHTLRRGPGSPPASAVANSVSTPPADPATSMPPTAGAARAPARRFGNYDLVDTIAKGGMGVVYKARHVKLNRIVALKMILSGKFADDLEVQRFYSEAEAAAKLRHPNIVGIHDIGECEGQHYFSMDYIEGKSLADLLKDNALPPRQAAEMMRTIATAMHFAHTEGIVHRDLKPSNILLDAAGSPLITDFGLAKQVQGNAGQSQMTIAGTVVGTPSYMPPEQAAGKIELINVRSDVYSLGAILYEMLSGRPPFRGTGVVETLRQVQEVEPVALRVLNRNIPRDLETICHKCLQKEPSKRYATAGELADELGRYLRGEPILAQPIGPVARGWRWCKRNPVVAATSAAALLGLVSALGATTVGYVKTSAALAQSEESHRQALQAVNDLFTQVSENTLLNKPGLQPLRKELLARALTYYQRFLKQRAGDPRVQDELASAHFRIALITEAIESTDKALPLYETARTMQERLVQQTPKNPARLEAYGNTLNALGTALATKKQHSKAQETFVAAAGVRTQLTQLSPGNSEYRRLLANTYMNLGVSLRGSGEPEKARERFVQAQEIRRDALKADPDNWKLRRDLGKGHYGLANLARQQDQLSEAQDAFAKAAKEFEFVVAKDPADLDNRRLLSVCYRLLGDLASAEDVVAARNWYDQARSRLKPLAEQNPEVVDYQVELAGLELNRGYLDSDDGQSAAAIAAFSEACRILLPLVEGSAALPRHRRELANACRALGSEQIRFGQHEPGLENLRKARNELIKLVKEFPDEHDYAQQLQETTDALAAAEETSPEAIDGSRR